MQQATFESFVAACLPALGRYAYKLTRDRDASEELVQDTLVKLAGAWQRVRQDGNPVGYAQTAMLRTYVSRWRRERRGPVTEPYDEEEGPPHAALGGPDRRYADVEARDVLRRVLRDLPRMQRVVLVLTDVDDLPDERIADLLGRRPATVRSIRFRALAAVRERLGGDTALHAQTLDAQTLDAQTLDAQTLDAQTLDAQTLEATNGRH